MLRYNSQGQATFNCIVCIDSIYCCLDCSKQKSAYDQGVRDCERNTDNSDTYDLEYIHYYKAGFNRNKK